GTPSDAFTNPLGGIHGGWMATLLDSSMACAVHTRLAAGQAYTTVEFKLNLVKAVTPATGKLRCEGRVLQFGNRIATSEGFVRDAAGTLYAHGTETCLVMPARGYSAIVPSITGTHCPATRVRAPRSSHHNSPPRFET
ncbi:MAG: PaaI family thioesterase, partial [Stellaceae bacterium]